MFIGLRILLNPFLISIAINYPFRYLLHGRRRLALLVTLFTLSCGCQNEGLLQSRNEPSDLGPQWKALHLRSKAQKESGVQGGEGMQMIQMAQFALSNPNYVYFVVDTSQVWRSIDGGMSWEPKPQGFRAIGGVSLVVDPRNEKVVFVSGAIPTGGSPVDGIYRTLDGGDSWELVKQTYYEKGESDREDPGEGEHYAFDPQSFDGDRHLRVFAATHKDGLFESNDGGSTWAYLGLSGNKILDVELHRSGEEITLYVATNTFTNNNDSGLFKVTLSDLNHNPTIAPLGILPNYPRTIALVPQDDSNNDILYAVCGSRNGVKSSLYKSSDGGVSFVSIDPDETYMGEYRSVSVSLADPNYIFLKPDNDLPRPFMPFFSHDGGQTWNTPTSVSNNDEIHTVPYNERGIAVAPHPTDPNIAISFFDGNSPRMTRDGGFTWSYSGHGYSGGRRVGASSSYFDRNDPNRMIFFLLDFGPVLSTDGGQSFSRMTARVKGLQQSTAVGAVDPDDANTILVAGGVWTSQVLYRTTDGGATWTKSLDPNGSEISGDFIFFTFHPQNSSYVYAGSKTDSWISLDRGATFSKVSNLSIMGVFAGDGDTVYALNGSDLYSSSDRGTTFQKLTSLDLSNIRELVPDPEDPTQIYVVAAGDLYRWNGTSVEAIGIQGGIPKETFGNTTTTWLSTMTIDPLNPNNIYVGARSGNVGHREEFVFRSRDRGKTFENIRYNLPTHSSVWALSIDPHTGALHMCTAHGNFTLANPSRHE